MPPTVFHILLQRLPMIGQVNVLFAVSSFSEVLYVYRWLIISFDFDFQQVQARQIATYGIGAGASDNDSRGDGNLSITASMSESKVTILAEDDELE